MEKGKGGREGRGEAEFMRIRGKREREIMEKKRREKGKEKGKRWKARKRK